MCQFFGSEVIHLTVAITSFWTSFVQKLWIGNKTRLNCHHVELWACFLCSIKVHSLLSFSQHLEKMRFSHLSFMNTFRASLTKILYFHHVFMTACNYIGCFHWHFLFSWSPPPQPTWVSCFTSVSYGIYCFRENAFCLQWVEEVFTPVVHLLMNLTIINPVSYKAPVRMSWVTKMPIYLLAFCAFHFLLYSLLSFLHQFNLHFFCHSLCGNLCLVAWFFIMFLYHSI
jgi:hypothetical protein